MSQEYRDNPIFAGKSPEQLKGIAGNCIILATDTREPLERLVFLQYSSEALKLAEFTVEDLGLKIADIIRVANHSYSGSAPVATAINQLALSIITSYPRVRQ